MCCSEPHVVNVVNKVNVVKMLKVQRSPLIPMKAKV
jgi:hypothetical protein